MGNLEFHKIKNTKILIFLKYYLIQLKVHLLWLVGETISLKYRRLLNFNVQDSTSVNETRSEVIVFIVNSVSLHFLAYNCEDQKHVFGQKMKSIKTQIDQDFSDTV